MRLLILADTKIQDSQLAQLQAEFSDFIHTHTQLRPEYFIQRTDYSTVPTEADSDGDLKPTSTYLTALTDEVHAKYGDYGVDSVVMLVHRDNWIFTGIWGTNWSNVYRKYHVHLCRFDNRNMANSFGTLYHEWMHSLDALILEQTGFEIDTLFAHTKCWVNWDSSVIHANRFQGCKETPYEYIRWKENTDALAMIAPKLREAYQARKDKHFAPVRAVQMKVISFLQDYLRRLLGARKDGVPKGT